MMMVMMGGSGGSSNPRRDFPERPWTMVSVNDLHVLNPSLSLSTEAPISKGPIFSRTMDAELFP